MMHLAVGAALFLILLDLGAVVPREGMDSQAVLYALSTLAQTCAALVAFVGAVGIYRLGQLAEQQKRADAELRVFADRVGLSQPHVVPIREVVSHVEGSRARANEP